MAKGGDGARAAGRGSERNEKESSDVSEWRKV